MSELTPQEITTCVTLLAKLPPGFLPLEIFDQVARLVRLPMVDVVPIRWEEDELYIGLVKRDTEDKWWPDMWHIPGTVLRSTDTMDVAIKRLLDTEIVVETCDAPGFHTVVTHTSDRGAEVVIVHTISNCIFQKSSTVQWFPINELPEKFIASEKDVVEVLSDCVSAAR